MEDTTSINQNEGKNDIRKIELAFTKYEAEEDNEYISKGKGEDLIRVLIDKYGRGCKLV